MKRGGILALAIAAGVGVFFLTRNKDAEASDGDADSGSNTDAARAGQIALDWIKSMSGTGNLAPGTTGTVVGISKSADAFIVELVLSNPFPNGSTRAELTVKNDAVVSSRVLPVSVTV